MNDVIDMLNEAQRNRLTIVLRGLEMSLRDITAWLAEGGEEEVGILYRRRLTLPDDRKEAVLREIESALDEIAQLAALLRLPAHESDRAAQIAAEMSIHWSDLVDSRTSKLRRYGAVQPALAPLLDKRLDRLAGGALKLIALFRKEDDAPKP